MKESKKQVNDLILNIAMGSESPKVFNEQVTTLNKLVNAMFEHIDEVESNNVELTANYTSLETEHKTLQTKYHEKWGNEDLDPDEDHDPDDVEIKTVEDTLKTLENLSQKGE